MLGNTYNERFSVTKRLVGTGSCLPTSRMNALSYTKATVAPSKAVWEKLMEPGDTTPLTTSP